MNLHWLVLGFSLACANVGQAGVERARRFDIDVPSGFEIDATVLVLRRVAVPRNAATIIRAHAVASDSSRVLLGSAAIPGIARDAEGLREVRELRLIATRGLRQWNAISRSARRVSVEVTAITADSTSIPGARWSVHAVELVPSR